MTETPRVGDDRHPRVTVIIPRRTIGEYETECTKACLALDYDNFEILLLPDSDSTMEVNDARVKLKVTGVARPAVKRNQGLRHASGELIAFLDSDAYPRSDWLKNAVEFFQKVENVGLLGGPNLTPPTDEFLQQVAGDVLSSRLGAGALAFRYSVSEPRVVDDLPSCNLIGRKSVLQSVGGFNVDFWPGEDTYLCSEIRNKLGLKLYYSPDIVVYHHRRPLFRPHLKQIWNYGLHRGYFARRFPTNSRSPRYLAPAILVVGLTLGTGVSMIIPSFSPIFSLLVALYVALCGLAAVRRGIRRSIYVWAGIMLTHFTYGLGFLKGILSRRLPEEREAERLGSSVSMHSQC